jgi:3-isopropylmalate/(R)-2-methylmalate dehydratase small subunit
MGRIFYRNALNSGLLAIVCPEAARAIVAGERVTVDLTTRSILCGAGMFRFPPLSPSILGIVEAGGLVPYVKQRLATAAARP